MPLAAAVSAEISDVVGAAPRDHRARAAARLRLRRPHGLARTPRARRPRRPRPRRCRRSSAICAREGVPFVARGAGTGLSGGALPVADGIVISLARMNRILEIDLASQRVVVEPGVANLDVTRAVAADGFFYAPDPSSQQVCTIGGNVAENSGGAHCLKNGFTVNHVTGLDGRPARRRGRGARRQGARPDGPDLLGVFVGSEGTLGIATRDHPARRPQAGGGDARSSRRSGRSTRRARRCRRSSPPGSCPPRSR